MNTGQAYLGPLHSETPRFWCQHLLVLIHGIMVQCTLQLRSFMSPEMRLRTHVAVQAMSSMAHAISEFEPLARFSRNSVSQIIQLNVIPMS
jgi:hypothetical protein